MHFDLNIVEYERNDAVILWCKQHDAFKNKRQKYVHVPDQLEYTDKHFLGASGCT